MPTMSTGFEVADGYKCRIRVTLDESGKVVGADFEPNRAHPVCNEPRLDARKQRFSPGTVNGHRVKSTGWIEYIFTDSKDKNTPSASPSPSPLVVNLGVVQHLGGLPVTGAEKRQPGFRVVAVRRTP